LLSEEDINYFITRIDSSYPVSGVINFNERKEWIEGLGLKISRPLTEIECKVLYCPHKEVDTPEV
jgi:hypothetical protein